MINFNDAVALAREKSPRLLAIDGLPVSGKSTLAERLERELGATTVYLDDFVLPEGEWRHKVRPGLPFPYIAYDAFVDVVETLAQGQVARYQRYDWSTGRAGAWRVVEPLGLITIEGVSVLNPDLSRLYDLRFWVESDAQTTLAASLSRGVGDWEQEWRELFMPSVALYLETRPQAWADHLVAGRDAGQQSGA